MGYVNNIKQSYCLHLMYTDGSSSNEGMPQKYDTPSEVDIMAKFPEDMLTPKVRSNILNGIEHMEASHTEAAEVM